MIQVGSLSFIHSALTLEAASMVFEAALMVIEVALKDHQACKGQVPEHQQVPILVQTLQFRNFPLL
jgi:hypothetical protein